jgi:transcriptional regulator with XRE-family HTH domain
VPSSVRKLLIPRLRALRKHHKLTQEKFSELSGIAYKYYQHTESGRRVDLRLSTLEKIATAYGVGLHELLSPSMPETKVKSFASDRQRPLRARRIKKN